MSDFGFWPILHLIALVYAAMQIMGSSADTVKKAIWVIIVAMLPLIGLIIWFFMGPGSPRQK